MDDITIRRAVSRGMLRWPSDEECEGELGLNRQYLDLRGMSAEDVAYYLEQEAAFIAAVGRSEDYYEALDRWDEACGPEALEAVMSGVFVALDPGVASTVAAVSAIGCIPFSSCNGGVLGGDHTGDHPYVAFFTRPEHLPKLLSAAEAANCGLANDTVGEGALLAYAAEIPPLQRFARHLAGLAE